MWFQRKRETWGVTFTGTNGEQQTIWVGSRTRVGRIVVSLQFVYKDARLVRLPHG